MSDQIMSKLIEHDEQFKEMSQKLDLHNEQFKKIDEKFERVFSKLLDHDRDIEWIKENVATKQEMHNVMTTLDQVVTIVNRIDEDRLATLEWLKRVDVKVDREADRNDIQEQRLEKLEFGVAVA